MSKNGALTKLQAKKRYARLIGIIDKDLRREMVIGLRLRNEEHLLWLAGLAEDISFTVER